MSKEKLKNNLLILIVAIIAVLSMIEANNRRIEKRKKKEEEKIVEKEDNEIVGNFNVDIIKKIHAADSSNNYLLSPYNIMIALNMLRDGSDGKTKEELDKVLGSSKINDLRVENKIGIANGVFIKNKYQNKVLKSYYDTLKEKYEADIKYDEFKTPKVINDWVNEKTWGMIDKILDTVDENYVMGLASALAIDVKWKDAFECNLTFEEEFIKQDNSKMNTEMMHKTYKNSDYKYINNDLAKGIIIPYEKEENTNVELEFIGLNPKTSIDDFIKNLTKEKLDHITIDAKEANNKFHINLSLPRFKYSYEVEDFKKVLQNIGVTEIFKENEANLTKIMPHDDEINNLYVSDTIHKTFIDLSETGTKAAAVTYFGFKNASAMLENDFEEVDVKFNKPFVYIIRERNTNDLLFFGIVYEPNKWEKTTCMEN